ncbi:hypothetical protein I553_4019 [Mycobacterium xenopi 4042]|uniref:Uncharacterized protein n=1 Tax=Mycobacterium xenopi 4042 TaxID=1299334 RepID=X8BC96_MYCXE|nr:hypothetical protein I553_4019 [Mycobacterium xenopi 4042]
MRARYGVVDIAAAPLTPEHRVHYFTEAPPVFFGPARCRSAARCCCRRPPPPWCTPSWSRRRCVTTWAVSGGGVAASPTAVTVSPAAAARGSYSGRGAPACR